MVTLLHCICLMQRLHHNLLDLCKYLMMHNSLWQMLHTRTFEDPILDIPEGTAGRGCGRAPRGNAPPPPPHAPISIEQLLTTQNDLMRLIVENEMHHVVVRPQPRHQDRDSSYSNFLVTHRPVFAGVIDPLEVDK
jgi:hypothetical protein